MRVIEEFCDKFGIRFVVPADLNLRVIGHNLHLFTNEQAEILDSRQPVVGGGIFLGEVARNVFTPSTQFLDIFLKQSKQSVAIDEKTAWLFMCGRDVIEASGIVPQERPSTHVTLKDKSGQLLGYGIVCDPRRKFGIVIKNLYDKGILLRREMKK